MKVTPIPHGLEDIVGRNKPGYVRGAGLHMSAIYGDLYQDLEPERFKRGTAPDPLRLELGMAFEELLEEGLKRRLVGERPDELQESEYGILFSPDLIIFNGVTRVGEIKLTWMSSREVPRETSTMNGFPPKFDKYFCQLMAYCRCLETVYGRLIVFFVNGAYENFKTGNPELLAWDLEFTRRELDENWSMLINHAKKKGML